jgi:branched-chain amino acid transport system permease protein
VGSLLGGAYYVLVPEITNIIDPGLTAVLQGAILLAVLFLLPGGLVSLPRLWRRRGRPVADGRRQGPSTASVAASTAPPDADPLDATIHPPKKL